MAGSAAVFMAMGTQWNWTGAGFSAFQTGLQYGVLPVVAAGLKVELTPSVFGDIRVMELEALKVWSARRG
jgi:isopentenyl phosphate kinase